MEMSAVFKSPKQSIPAKIANSIADAPLRSEENAALFLYRFSAVLRRISFVLIRTLLRSINQSTSARNRCHRHVQASLFAAFAIGTLLVNIACPINKYGV